MIKLDRELHVLVCGLNALNRVIHHTCNIYTNIPSLDMWFVVCVLNLV